MNRYIKSAWIGLITIWIFIILCIPIGVLLCDDIFQALFGFVAIMAGMLFIGLEGFLWIFFLFIPLGTLMVLGGATSKTVFHILILILLYAMTALPLYAGGITLLVCLDNIF